MELVVNKMACSIQRLKEVLHYDAASGVFTWRITVSSRAVKDDEAGWLCGPYVRIQVDGEQYQAHVLAWFYVTGEWPKEFIDHKNLIKTDNRFDNLREATNSQNQANTVPKKKNKHGVKGVAYNKRLGMWNVTLRVDGKQILNTTRKNYDEAVQVLIDAEKLQGIFRRVGGLADGM